MADKFTRSVGDLYARGLDRGDEYEADAMGAAESYQYGQVTIEDRVEVVYKLK